ncbi:hypothetical protein [Caenimonas koreensis]|uniref:hypothetical protein n=1 Tax=Caenimonas koreensis TaxID=367474 RepID=UPI0037837B12
MTQIFKLLVALLVAAVVAACGGGGGSAGTTTGGGTPPVVTPSLPTLTISLVNSADAAIVGNSIGGTPVFAKAVLKDGSGAAIVNKLVSFSGASALVKFTPASGSVLTDANGVARVLLTPASSTAAGAGTIGVAATIDNSTGDPTALSASIDIQVTSTGAPLTPTLTLSIVDSAGAQISNNSVTNGNVVFAKAVLKDGAGAAVPNKLVVFLSGSNLTKFQPSTGQVLTDAAGVAKVQLVPASLTTAGAETITANATVPQASTPVNLTATIDIQTSAANVTLTNFTATQPTLTTFQSTPVSVDVNVNGAAATGTPVQVSFTANCGSFAPAQVTSNSAGKAVSTFQATGCSAGTATITASATGAAASATANLTISAATPTNLLFVKADPTTIYTLQAAFGVKQATVQFKVVDASGNGVGPGTQVLVSLSTSAIAAGVTFADTGTTATKTLTTDVNGLVNAIVKAGSVPTPLSVNAAIVGTGITASSANLSVNSGQPVQNFFSLSADKYNIEGDAYDGEIIKLSVLVADRLGQPVPAGTPISFITEGGQVTASCFVTIDENGKSGCSVSLVSQAFRPADGRVTILAYTEGEEPFEDANGNNKYDPGEVFYDMGQPFLDSNWDFTWNASPAEQKVGDPSIPSAGIGTSVCPASKYGVFNVPSTCNGVWGATRVRSSIVVTFSTSFALPAVFSDISTSGVTVKLQDFNNNGMPNGTKVDATISGGVNCTLQSVIPDTVQNTTAPTFHRVIISKGNAAGDSCIGAEVSVKATTPKGNQTLLGKVVIP